MGRCDKYGFFNGVYGIEQANWADYWKGVIPDGVVAGSGENVDSQGHKEMEVYPAGGLQVYIAPGEAMVDNHKVWIMSRKTLSFDANESLDPRIDSVILRVIYGNDGESYAEYDVKKGAFASTPIPPILTQVTGTIYEYRLANVLIGSEVGNITTNDITDERYVFSIGSGAITLFKEETLIDEDTQESYRQCIVNAVDGREYRTPSNHMYITNELTINLPKNPVSTFMCEFDFSTKEESVTEIVNGENVTTEYAFKGINFRVNDSDYNIKCSNLIVATQARYNLLVWWDGLYYWADCKVVS